MAKLSDFVSTTLLKLSQLSQQFGLGSIGRPTWDILLILFLLIAAFLYGMNIGRNRMWVIILGSYVSLVLVEHFPYWDYLTSLGGLDKWILNTTFFVILTVLFFILVSRTAFGSVFSSKFVVRSWFHVILFSIIHIGLIIAIVLNFLPDNLKKNLSDFTIQIFGNKRSEFWWIIASALIMGLIRKKKEKFKK